MKLLQRIVYLGYYFRRMNWPLLRRFMRHTREKENLGNLRQIGSFIGDSLRYNISPLEWYQFRFSALSGDEKSIWAGTGTMYEFHRRMNPPAARAILADKRRFYLAYRDFCSHGLWSLQDLRKDPDLVARILDRHDRLVFKDATGNCGTSVRILPTSELNAPGLTRWMAEQEYDMVESFIRQHPDLMTLSPSGVNTVRIFTCIERDGAYRILGCRLRISVNSHVDNLAAGNLAAPIDEATGLVSGPGVYADITKSPESVHPVTGTAIEGFQVPFWRETFDLVKQASLLHTENRSIGWDVVIMPDGPGLLEGNHDWCKLVWQLPVRRGLKPMLDTE